MDCAYDSLEFQRHIFKLITNELISISVLLFGLNKNGASYSVSSRIQKIRANSKLFNRYNLCLAFFNASQREAQLIEIVSIIILTKNCNIGSTRCQPGLYGAVLAFLRPGIHRGGWKKTARG